MGKSEFKTFVRNNPKLVEYVDKGESTWQKFYELYDIYGEDNNIWSKYLESTTSNNNSVNIGTTGLGLASIKELFGLFKGIDLNTVQKALTSVNKAIGTFRDLNNNSDRKEENTYEERPIYKYFED